MMAENNPSMGNSLKRILAATILFVGLIYPNHPDMIHWGVLTIFPLELPVIIALLVGTGATAAAPLIRWLLVGSVGFVVLLRSADIGTYIAYNRGFNLLADLHFTPAVWMLLVGSVGWPFAVMIVASGVAAFLGFMVALAWSARVWADLPVSRGMRLLALVVLAPAMALVVADINRQKPDLIPGEAFAARVGIERTQEMVRTYQTMHEFRQAARIDPMASQGPFFGALDGRDLILIYIESYGRSSFENPLYAPTHVGTLENIEARLSDSGLAMRAGWATAPMTGGQSWLAHGSVATGLWLHNQPRYRAMLASGRRTLFHYAQTAGLRTVAIKPAHVMGWPEGAAFNFDAIYNAADLGYEGPPYNWVTMPDQFTLKAFERLEQKKPDRPPLLAQIALISSHAPWVPIPELVDWDAIGDGRIFEKWAFSDDPPEVVWRDQDRVRDQFRRAVDYSLQVVGSWAERQADDPPLIIILGDHEPARFVAGIDSHDVPIHVIGPPDLVNRFAALNWTEGLIPAPATPAFRMDRLRDLWLEALSANSHLKTATSQLPN